MKTKFLSKMIPLCILIMMLGFQLLPASHALALEKQSILSDSNPNSITVSVSIDDADNWFDYFTGWFDSVSEDFRDTGEKIKKKFESIKNSIASLFSSVDDGVETFSSDGGNGGKQADKINNSIDKTVDELKNDFNGNSEGSNGEDNNSGEDPDEKTNILTDFDEVASYVKKHGVLPDNFITKAEAKRLGWNPKKGNLAEVAPGKSIGGDVFKNKENLLPNDDGRVWYEADINYSSGFRGNERLLYSNDGLIYKTVDHYQTFTRIH
jgi:ribonuclease